MSLHRLRVRQQVPAPLDEVWAFFSDPRNLAVMTPPWLAMEFTSGPPAAMYPGLVVACRIRPFPGLRASWATEITHVRDREYFVDEQRAGPYSLWHHEHHFRALDAATTEIRDILHYALPFGPLGDIINGVAVRKRVRGIFAYRRQALAARWPIPASR